MSLNRDSVKDYVNKFWMHPCDDGVINSYVKGPFKVEDERKKLAKQGKLPDPSKWTAIFCPDVDDKGNLLTGKERACFIKPNPSGQEIPVHSSRPPEITGRFDVVTFHHDKGLVDCAHYVSRCLTTSGVKINQPGVDGLVSKLRNMKDIKTVGHKVSKAQGEKILNTGVMKPGDVVAYMPPKKNDYSHSTIYMGRDTNKVHRITCHTLSRHQSFYDDAAWNITDDEGWRYTLLHFGHDDTTIPTTFLSALTGWFQVTVAGKNHFYRFHADGHVDRLDRRPANSRSVSLSAQSRGYWFVRPTEIVICFPFTGELDRISTTWVASGTPLTEFQLLVNGMTATAQTLVI